MYFDLGTYNLEKACLHYFFLVTTSLWKHITLMAMGLNELSWEHCMGGGARLVINISDDFFPPGSFHRMQVKIPTVQQERN